MALINGTSANDNLVGTHGPDTINGGLGADDMSGLVGNDVYYVDNVGDVVHEAAGQGTDTIISAIALSSAMANVENYTFTSAAPVSFTGNSLDNVIQAGAGADVIFGYGGHDQIYGNGGNDALLGWTGIDELIGGAGNDVLNGLGGNDKLDGGNGADVMYGGDGDDTYYVDNIGDDVHEDPALSSGQRDTIISTIALAAVNGIENYTFNTAAAVHLTASSAQNVIQSGSGADVIHGGAGLDWISGGAGNDQIYADADRGVLKGEAGNDQLFGSSAGDDLDGGTGADKMTGGAGDDDYTVDNAGDRVTELASEGRDTVISSVSVGLLWDNVEGLALTGTGNINATGNALDNTIRGNDHNNIINGGTGDDVIAGLHGNDTLTGGAGSDIFYFHLLSGDPGDGTDRITDFDRATDRLEFADLSDKNGDGAIDLADVLDISHVVDHGAGHDVTVTFDSGAVINFTGAGTGSVHSLTDLVAAPSQIYALAAAGDPMLVVPHS